MRVLNKLTFFLTTRSTTCLHSSCHSSISTFNPAVEGPTTHPSKTIPKTKDEYKSLKTADIIQPDQPKSLRVAILGRPNAGKSTLLNALVQHRVSSVSSKVHTTRKNVIGVLSEGSTQIEFMDTPGLVRLDECVKHRMEHTLYNDPHKSACIADVILVLVDVSLRIYRRFLSIETFKVLAKHREKKSVLVLNKVDDVKTKRKLLHCIDRLTGGYVDGKLVTENERHISKAPKSKAIRPQELRKIIAKAEKNYKLLENLEESESSSCDNDQQEMERSDVKLDPDIDPRNLHWPYFSRIFMISALTGDGVDDLKNYLLSEAKPKEWKYPSAVVTNQGPESIILSTIREKFLENCKWDIPYTLDFRICEYSLDEQNNMHLLVNVIVAKEFQMAYVLGVKGVIIGRIADEVRQELGDLFHCDVRLKLIAVCRETKK